MPPITENRTFDCYNCGRARNEDDACVGPNGYNYCDNCWGEFYFVCDSCSETRSNEDYSRNGYCYDCEPSDNDEDIIPDGSYYPTMNFRKEPWENTLYQGVELEIELAEDINPVDHAQEFLSWLEKHGLSKVIFIKNDGSLNNGYEIVSHPFTPRARHKHLRWRDVLAYLKRTGAKAFKTKTCGLHIHVSKAALTTDEISKIKMFFGSNKLWIERIAGRRENDYCLYQSYGIREHLYRNTATGKSTLENHGSRYCAVNVNRSARKNTVEFRIFKGTLDFKRFLGCLQFTEAICDYVKDHSAIAVQKGRYTQFKEWVKSTGRFEHLERHIRKVRG